VAIANATESDYIAAKRKPGHPRVARKSSARDKASPPPPPPAEGEADVEEQETETVPAATSTDNVGDISVEVNVEDLIAQIESESKGVAPDGSARRRIEDILEEKRVAKEIMDLEDFDIDE
jgi:hypothetical protein